MNYVVDGKEQVVDFGLADYDPQNQFEKTKDGVDTWLWSLTDGTFDFDSEYKYLDVYGFGHSTSGTGLSYRHFLSFGARTDPANLPAGGATYMGRIRADSYKQNDPSSDFRDRVYGDLSLTANFDAGTLDGIVSGIHTRGQNEANSSPLSATTRLEIANGRIANGQFTATLTGVDTNATVALDETVRGYEGRVLGEFYGPAAEEVGGVFSASRDEDRSVMIGALLGKKQ